MFLTDNFGVAIPMNSRSKLVKSIPPEKCFFSPKVDTTYENEL